MRVRKLQFLLAFWFFLLTASSAFALVFKVPPPGDNVVGSVINLTADKDDTLYKLGRIYEIGKREMLEANPGLKEFGRIKPGVPVVIPSLFILPNTPRHGLTINLAERRLYFYPEDENVVITEPIAIGREGWETPTMETKVVQKIVNPEWVVPDTIMEYSIDKGVELPLVAAPGPTNPLGHFALRLGNWSVLIHGTSEPLLIGKRVSSGCIRMFPEDIAHLFEKVDVNTPVYVIDEPYKAGWQGHSFYLEVHQPMKERRDTLKDIQKQVYEILDNSSQGNLEYVNWGQVEMAVEKRSGVPVLINVG